MELQGRNYMMTRASLSQPQQAKKPFILQPNLSWIILCVLILHLSQPKMDQAIPIPNVQFRHCGHRFSQLVQKYENYVAAEKWLHWHKMEGIYGE